MADKTMEELQNEFNQLAFASGKLSYEIAQKTKDLEAFQNAMRDLSIQGAQLKSKEQENKDE